MAKFRPLPLKIKRGNNPDILKSQPPLPMRKWLLPNKVIGTKLQLVPVVEVCLYWPTAEAFDTILYIYINI
jgi:hypothetical protein